MWDAVGSGDYTACFSPSPIDNRLLCLFFCLIFVPKISDKAKHSDAVRLQPLFLSLLRGLFGAVAFGISKLSAIYSGGVCSALCCDSFLVKF